MIKKFSKRLKRLKNFLTQITYSVKDGLSLLKQLATAKFLESVEVHMSLNLDPRQSTHQLRDSLILPYGTGKVTKIGVLIDSESTNTVLDFGADVVGSEDLIEKICKGYINFDILITTQAFMPKLAKLGKILGPKGLMPTLKAGTITSDLKKTIQEFKKGRIEYRIDKTGIVHSSIGKINFSIEALEENFYSIYSSIQKNRPVGLKGKYLNSCSLCTTMSPGIFLNLNTITQYK